MLSLGLLWPTGASAEDTGPGMLCSWADLEPQERAGFSVAGAVLAREFLEARFETGRLFPLTACGRVVGYAFEGEGELDVRSPGPLRAPLLHDRYDNLPGTLLFDRALLIASDGAVDALLGAAGKERDLPVPTQVRAMVTARTRSFDPEADTWGPLPGEVLATPAGEASGLFAEFRTSGLKRTRRGGDLEILSDWLTYLWSEDGAQRDGEQGLWYRRRVGSTRGESLAAFPSAAALAEADSAFADPLAGPRWDLERAEVAVSIRPTFGLDQDLQDLSAVSVLHLRRGSPHATVPLFLSRGIRRNYGERFGPLKVAGAALQLAGADGAVERVPLRWDRVEDRLWVHLPEAATEATIEVRYEGPLVEPDGQTAIRPLAGWTWYPTVGFNDRHQFVATVTAPKYWDVAATGSLLEELKSGNLVERTFRERRPVRQGAVLLVNARQKVTMPPEPGLPVLRVFAGPRTRDPDAAVHDEVYRHLKTLAPLLGDFPYAELTVVERGVAGGGSDLPGVIPIGRFDSPPDQVVTTRAGVSSLLGALVRQYLAADMGPRTYHDAWLIEGLSLLGECRALEAAERADRCRGLVRDFREKWMDVVDGAAVLTQGTADEPEIGAVWLDRLSGRGGANRAYRAPLVLDSLRLLLGDDRTWALVERVARAYRGQALSTGSFLLHAEAVAGADLRPFFAWWVYATPPSPTAHLELRTEAAPDGTQTLVGEGWLDDGRDGDPLPSLVPLVLRIKAGDRDVVLRLTLTEERRPVRVEGLPAAPTAVQLDPGRTFPGKTAVQVD